MSQSNLIELTYYDPNAGVRLTAYADTIITDSVGRDRLIAAIRFGGYPEVVQALSDALYGGAAIDAIQNGTTHRLQSIPKRYQRQLSHDGVYAAATLMVMDDAIEADTVDEEEGSDNKPEVSAPRRCYLFCPAGDRDRLFDELDRKTVAPLIPSFRDYVLDSLITRGQLRQLKRSSGS